MWTTSSFANPCVIQRVEKWRWRKRENFYGRGFPNALWSSSFLRSCFTIALSQVRGILKRPTLSGKHMSFGALAVLELVWDTAAKIHLLAGRARVRVRARAGKREKKGRGAWGANCISNNSRVWMHECFLWKKYGQLSIASPVLFWIFSKKMPRRVMQPQQRDGQLEVKGPRKECSSKRYCLFTGSYVQRVPVGGVIKEVYGSTQKEGNAISYPENTWMVMLCPSSQTFVARNISSLTWPSEEGDREVAKQLRK